MGINGEMKLLLCDSVLWKLWFVSHLDILALTTTGRLINHISCWTIKTNKTWNWYGASNASYVTHLLGKQRDLVLSLIYYLFITSPACVQFLIKVKIQLRQCWFFFFFLMWGWRYDNSQLVGYRLFLSLNYWYHQPLKLQFQSTSNNC